MLAGEDAMLTCSSPGEVGRCSWVSPGGTECPNTQTQCRARELQNLHWADGTNCTIEVLGFSCSYYKHVKCVGPEHCNARYIVKMNNEGARSAGKPEWGMEV